ncbi:MAG: inner membrane CreD family protein [Planctomycetota bacterium]|jgi:hypothetical protein
MMSVKRVLAIVVIYVIACMGWMILGTTTATRSDQVTSRLGTAVADLWGTPLVQQAPSVSVTVPGSQRRRPIMPTQNEVTVQLELDYRQKGLIWYPTYVVHFQGAYTITNTESVAQKVRFHFDFPSGSATYDAFQFLQDGEALDVPVNTKEGVGVLIELSPGQSQTFTLGYRTRGLESWRYRIDPEVGRVKNLALTVTTDFAAIDYPEGSYSPTTPAKLHEGGATVTWQASDLITRQDMGILIPERLNPGPVASRITYFGPVCLIFFFVLVATIHVVKKIEIHPMHYLFVAAGFGAFHVLLAYLVDHLNIHVSFLLCALVSVGLVTSYLSATFKGRFPWRVAVAGQCFFLILFSYSFFLEGMTGLVVAVGSVVTLAVLMRLTADTDWSGVFGGGRAARESISAVVVEEG